MSQRAAERVDRAREQAASAAFEADMAAMNVRMVSAMTGQIDASIRAISESTEASRSETGCALERVHETTASVEELAEIGARIRSMVEAIRGITVTTNLLALNASIEAARAGEAGLGFGVVATEVKQLARRTQGATDEIIEGVEAIARATARALESMQHTASSVESIRTRTEGIADAIQEQQEVTTSIQTFIEEAATTIEGAAGVMKSVDEEATGASEQLHSVLDEPN